MTLRIIVVGGCIAELDLRSRHQPVTSTDLAPDEMWARQVVIDAAAKDAGRWPVMPSR